MIISTDGEINPPRQVKAITKIVDRAENVNFVNLVSSIAHAFGTLSSAEQSDDLLICALQTRLENLHSGVSAFGQKQSYDKLHAAALNEKIF